MPFGILLAVLSLPLATAASPAVPRLPARAVGAAVARTGPPAVLHSPLRDVGIRIRTAGSPPQPFVWPVTPPHVVRRFEPPPQPWLAGHRGVDLAASPSSVIRAAGSGVVIYAGTIAGRGVVSVAHSGGLRTTYEPVTSALHAGDAVTAGGALGRLAAGHPGCPTTACLHWGLRQGNRYLDPLALLGLGRVRLWPLQADVRGSPVTAATR